MNARLALADFNEYFKALNNGFQSFPWQERLARKVCDEGRFPDVLDLPTGSGKTACIDIALFHLALNLSSGEKRNAPLRIAWVVDRRIVVDEAYDRASRIARLLEEAKSGVLFDIAELFRKMAGPGAPPLVAVRLRGGMPLEGDWARTPTQPIVISSTVDQTGSRLLFRGYGVRARMRPIHAGLFGEDAIVVLDEVHLAEPFRQTLASVAERKIVSHMPWQTVALSATPRLQSAVEPFVLGADDWRDQRLEPRLSLPKYAELISVGRVQLGSSLHAERIAKEALRFTLADGAKKTLVVVNRVKLARLVHQYVERDLARHGLTNCATLLIGRNRAIAKDTLRDEIVQRCKSDPSGESWAKVERPYIVVATQCIEAGADLDFDALVTQIASIDALRQRFGRLNRMGRPIEAKAAVLATDGEVALSAKDDPIYGAAARETWRWLVENATDGCVDFAAKALHIQKDDLTQLTGRAPDAPVLMPEHVAALARTSPQPPWSPDPAIYLHGNAHESAEVYVVWRADLPKDAESGKELVGNLLTLVPPRTSEAVAVPIGTFRRWLAGKSNGDVPDQQGVPAEQPNILAANPQRHGWLWRGVSEKVRRTSGEGMRPGDTIVLSSTDGGCDRFGWSPEYDGEVDDVADAAAAPFGRRILFLRMHPALLEQARRHGSPDISPWRAVAEELRRMHESDYSSREILDELLDPESSLVLPESWYDILRELNGTGTVSLQFPYTRDGDEFVGEEGLIIVSQRSAREPGCVSELESATESDRVALQGPSAQGETLIQHSAKVRDVAHHFAETLQLPPALVQDIALAGFLHDVGKSDVRFQRYLWGNQWGLPEAIRAKSGNLRTAREDRKARRLSGLPPSWRHEALSVRIAREHPLFEQAHDPELVLWLIGSHHGCGRPAFPHADECDGEERSFYGFEPNATSAESLVLAPSAGPQRLDFCLPVMTEHGMQYIDWQTLFERLQNRYGVWGLAWFESILRLADHRASDQAFSLLLEAHA